MSPAERLEEMASDPALRQKGWDGHGATPLKDTAIDIARRILPILPDACWPVPTIEGGVELADTATPGSAWSIEIWVDD